LALEELLRGRSSGCATISAGLWDYPTGPAGIAIVLAACHIQPAGPHVRTIHASVATAEKGAFGEEWPSASTLLASKATRRWRWAVLAPVSDFLVAQIQSSVKCVFASERLPTADSEIDVEGINLKPAAAPANSLGGQQCCARAAKAVQNDIVSPGAVLDGVSDHLDRLYRGMQMRIIRPTGLKSTRP
jgi:hypothetical protein